MQRGFEVACPKWNKKGLLNLVVARKVLPNQEWYEKTDDPVLIEHVALWFSPGGADDQILPLDPSKLDTDPRGRGREAIGL